MSDRQGRTELPQRQSEALRRAVRLEWITIGFLTVTVTAVFLVMGNSQAMRAAWIEDMLSFIPPLAFLLAVRLVARPPTARYPYGYHRSIGVAHLVAAVALTAMGSFLIYESATGLFKGEHPPIGTVEIFGAGIWLGWLMMLVMALTSIPPVIVGRIKNRLARELHDKVLFADADMNKADWMTAVGSIVGIAGIGLGFWWTDAAAALFIALSILRDGLRNMRAAITDLVDTQAATFDDKDPHPLAGDVQKYLTGLPWVQEAGVRMRDQGQVFHVEAFVVPAPGAELSLKNLLSARERCAGLDWKLRDTVLIPVDALPDEVGGRSGVRQSEKEE